MPAKTAAPGARKALTIPKTVWSARYSILWRMGSASKIRRPGKIKPGFQSPRKAEARLQSPRKAKARFQSPRKAELLELLLYYFFWL